MKIILYVKEPNKIYLHFKVSIRFFSISLKIFGFSRFLSQIYFVIFRRRTIIIPVFFPTEKNSRISLNVNFNKFTFLSLSRFFMKIIVFNEIQGCFTKSLKRKGDWKPFNDPLAFKCDHLIVLHFTHEFYNSETILLMIDKRNLLNFNGCILKRT